MSPVDDLREAAALQARLCREASSPTYAAIVEAIAGRLDDPGAVACRLVLDDRRHPVRSAVFLRLLGAVHRLVLDGIAPGLAACYPTAGGTVDPPTAVDRFFEVVASHRDGVAHEMQVDVQTNDPGRSVVLAAALAWLAREHRLPVRLFEVGASAGLNLWVDRYRIDAGRRGWGPAGAHVRLPGDFVGDLPPGDAFEISERRGCDVEPLDVGTASGRRMLRSFVWPEHTDRLERLDRAMASFVPVPVDRAPAGVWLRERVRPEPGSLTVVFHSIVMPYLSGAERREVDRLLDDAGGRASADAPLARVAMEPVGEGYEAVALTCQRWPGGHVVRLATCTPHALRIAWRPVAVTDFPAGSPSASE